MYEQPVIYARHLPEANLMSPYIISAVCDSQLPQCRVAVRL